MLKDNMAKFQVPYSVVDDGGSHGVRSLPRERPSRSSPRTPWLNGSSSSCCSTSTTPNPSTPPTPLRSPTSSAFVSPTESVGPPRPDRRDQSRDVMATARLGFRGVKPHRVEVVGFTNASAIMCYRNSVIAMLLNLKPFVGWLTIDSRSALWDANPDPQSSVLRPLTKLATRYWSKKPRATKAPAAGKAMKDFWTAFAGAGKHWDPEEGLHTQQDASEFLNALLMAITNEASTLGFHLEFNALAEAAWYARRTCADNCMNRKHRAYSLDVGKIWSIYMPDPSSDSSSNLLFLTDCVANTLRSKTEWRCPDCASNSVDAHVSKRLHSAPEILFIQIWRFDRVAYTGDVALDYVKSRRHVEVPEYLDLTKYLEEDERKEDAELAVYRLDAAVTHAGELNSGHYICHVRAPDGVGWVRINDNVVDGSGVEMVNEDVMGFGGGMEFQPYILAFTRMPSS